MIIDKAEDLRVGDLIHFPNGPVKITEDHQLLNMFSVRQLEYLQETGITFERPEPLKWEGTMGAFGVQSVGPFNLHVQELKDSVQLQDKRFKVTIEEITS